MGKPYVSRPPPVLDPKTMRRLGYIDAMFREQGFNGCAKVVRQAYLSLVDLYTALTIALDGYKHLEKLNGRYVARVRVLELEAAKRDKHPVDEVFKQMETPE